LHREAGNLGEAEACLLRLLHTRPGAYFDMVDAGLRGYKTRHVLATIYQQQKRWPDAEAQLRVAVPEGQEYVPVWLSLGDVYLGLSRWSELEEVAKGLESQAASPQDAAILRGRARLARKEYVAARRTLEEACAQAPKSVGPRLLLSHVLLEEGRDWSAAERTL